MATEIQDAPGQPAAADELEEFGTAYEAGRYGTGVKVLVAAAAALVFLLVGAAGGMLITLSRSDQGGVPGADSVDVGFAQDMSVHHLQAVTMASLARDRSTDPSIRVLAFDIESTQQGQVGMMSGWLTLWNQPTLPLGTYMAWMSGPAAHGHGATTGSVPAEGVRIMPGMATQQELTRLRSLSGAELDVYFLQLVLRHHAGGAPMAQYAADRAGQSAVRALADSIVKSQTAEMETIKSMLAQRGAQPWP
ncbi:DUF305 domain-containing protein [Amycolatopsis sp. NPDC006131]|uniref:DUF305 domain-containing protein n=1 Tax=Amycolatopsis sp. NPDC006131 TaxID=3156731 RepID=UPI00339F99D3